jgi:hypothetical protein
MSLTCKKRGDKKKQVIYTLLVERGVTDNLLRTEELAENRIKNLGEKKS